MTLNIDPKIGHQRFRKQATDYEAHAQVQKEIASRLAERLQWLKHEPQTVVDLGCGTGLFTQSLLKHYPKAIHLAIDQSPEMLRLALSKKHWFKKARGVAATAQQLPIQDDCIDAIFSSLMLQWCPDLVPVFSEWARVCRANGLVMFTTFGPDTLQEIRQAWAEVDDAAHTSDFLDMHDIGDVLLAAGFQNPVMDRENITVTYQHLETLLQDLKGIGANNAHLSRPKGLTGKNKLKRFFQAMEAQRNETSQIPLTYEVIYGHAWAPQRPTDQLPEHYIPIQSV